MPKRSPAEQLDRMVSAILTSLPPEPEQHPSPSLARLVPISQALRETPRAEFRQALKIEMRSRATLKETTPPSPAGSARRAHFVRPGFNNIAPYILVNRAADFMDFLKSAFGVTEQLRVTHPDGAIAHAQVGIGNSVIELSDANQQHPACPSAIHLYLDDADATFERALRAGAASLHPVADQPWGDRQGSVKDAFGNVWYIGMIKGWKPGPEGLRSVQPYLHLREAHNMIPFVEAAFGGEVQGDARSPEGQVLHATIKIGNATIEIDEAHSDFQPMPCYLHLYVPDTDALYRQALRAGATSVAPPANQPYGDRAAGVKDPFGNTWYLATYLGSAEL